MESRMIRELIEVEGEARVLSPKKGCTT